MSSSSLFCPREAYVLVVICEKSSFFTVSSVSLSLVFGVSLSPVNCVCLTLSTQLPSRNAATVAFGNVPLQISNLQLEQNCSILLSNASILHSSSKVDSVEVVLDVLISSRKELAVEIGELEKLKDELEDRLKKEDEMMQAITSYTMEPNVVDAWIKFVGSTWGFQASHTKKKEEQVKYVM
ncbi:hypothetical protein JHK84_028111 [Glycine max]|nr:hypothetical protein JHK85_028527 [Glycine max]KAG5151639.1 hypothetical protein JHK84_028111 [Glycine max]